MKNFMIPIVGLVGTLLIACSTPTVPPNKLVDGYCDIAKPILLAKKEIPILSQETKRQILVHNEIWARKCSK